MKKIFLLLSFIILTLALITFAFNVSTYDFFDSLNRAVLSSHFPNPLTQFSSVLEQFKSLDYSEQPWWAILDTILAIFNLILLPFNILKDVAIDLLEGLKFVLIVFGII